MTKGFLKSSAYSKTSFYVFSYLYYLNPITSLHNYIFMLSFNIELSF